MLRSKSGMKRKAHPAAKNLRAFDKQAKAAPQVRIGYPATELGSMKYPDSGVPVISVAFWQEFGTKNIPARSFLRSTMIEKRQDYRRALRSIAKKSIRGADLITLTKRLGFSAVGDVQGKITKVRQPPNLPATIRKKKSGNPLIDTGLMRSSTTFELRTGRNGRSKKD